MVAGLSAQEFRSTLMGHVSDPAGLGVPNAKVSVVKLDTNTRSDTVTGTDGNYTVPFLAPGTYQVAVEANGFKKYDRPRFEIGTNERIAIDVQLQIGSSSESVTVSADAPLLNLSLIHI